MIRVFSTWTNKRQQGINQKFSPNWGFCFTAAILTWNCRYTQVQLLKLIRVVLFHIAERVQWANMHKRSGSNALDQNGTDPLFLSVRTNNFFFFYQNSSCEKGLSSLTDSLIFRFRLPAVSLPKSRWARHQTPNCSPCSDGARFSTHVWMLQTFWFRWLVV